ncbi:MAG TPA: nuclear transport factor 2 family protein [Dehalococcoidia bacterium]|nr:nuclear transport factor 2 family protein [Dehalococcoidia bacterium]
MSTSNELVVSYLAAWNERDPRQRRDLVAKTWTEKGTYVDAHRRGDGVDGIDAMIGAAQAQFPGYTLHLVSGIEAQNGYVRFSWAGGGVPEAPLYLGGTDFAIVGDDGRFASVAGFVDAAPAPADR